MPSRKGSEGSVRGAVKGASAVFLVAVLLVVGCAHSDGGVPIAPLVPAAGRVDPGLGPGTRALSSGPGYKGSPSWSPRGHRIAFTVDGYVVDKPVDSGEIRRWTTRDFVAEDAEWISDDSLAILGAAAGSEPPSGVEEAPRSVYRARAGEGSFGLEKAVTGVLAMSPDPEKEGLVVAVGTGLHESGLALTRASGEVYQVYTSAIEGRVTAISPSPDGEKVVLAVRPPGDLEASELRVFDLQKGSQQQITRLDGNLEILGTPQWTKQGLYFVAGEKQSAGSGTPLYDLYRAPPEPGAPEPAPGVGKDFVASSIRVSPDGERLAVIGRLNPKSPANLYVLDPPAKDLRAVTTNEDMEIKTGPDDLAWSPGGKSVVIIARGAPSTEPLVRAAPADTLLKDFYNLYEIPVGGPGEAPR